MLLDVADWQFLIQCKWSLNTLKMFFFFLKKDVFKSDKFIFCITGGFPMTSFSLYITLPCQFSWILLMHINCIKQSLWLWHFHVCFVLIYSVSVSTRACVEVREQILGIVFLLPDEDPRDWTWVVRSGDKCFSGWAISWPFVVFPHIHTDLSSFASVSLVAPPSTSMVFFCSQQAAHTIESVYCLFMARGQACVSWYGDLQFLPFSCRRHDCILLCDWVIFHCVSSTLLFSSLILPDTSIYIFIFLKLCQAYGLMVWCINI